MKTIICIGTLLLLSLPAGLNSQVKAQQADCSKMKRTRGFFPKGPFKTLPGESYKRPPFIKYLIQEDGSVSDVRIIRSSGVTDIDKEVMNSVSQWKYSARPNGCGAIETQMSVLIHWGESH